MEKDLLSLEPRVVFAEFAAITKIPRPSGKEGKMVNYLKKWAAEHGYLCVTEPCGNVIIYVPANDESMEKRQTVILQAHMDMVCQDKGQKHDFENDPIEPVIEGNLLRANGTTLGADDGIGVAAALAAATSTKHGPLELLFTVDEETALTGAQQLNPENLHGKILINLDSETWKEVFVGCAGGEQTVIKLWYSLYPAPEKSTAYLITVSGLKGGHSGDDIEKNRANAMALLTRILCECNKTFDLYIYDYNCDNPHNAIATKATAVVYIPNENTEKFKDYVQAMEEIFKEEYQVTEPKLKVTAEVAKEQPDVVIDAESQFNLLFGLHACQHGVIAMSQTIPGFVRTSTNLASCQKKEGYFHIITSQRSESESELYNIAQVIEHVWTLAGAEVEHVGQYPGWTPNPGSKILQLAKEVFRKRFNEEAQVKTIHAGLECGVIGDMIPDLDMISFGPTLHDVHSPKETCEIDTVQPFWKLLCGILEAIPEE